MKYLFLTLSFLVANFSFAQTHEIIKHNGDNLAVNFIKLDNNFVYYSNTGSAEEFKISKYAVSQIKNKETNQVQKITDKIIVDSAQDYKLVQVISKEKTIGLKEIATFSGLKTKTKGEPPIALSKQTAMRIKSKLAGDGHPFVCITENNNGSYEAVAYTY